MLLVFVLAWTAGLFGLFGRPRDWLLGGWWAYFVTPMCLMIAGVALASCGGKSRGDRVIDALKQEGFLVASVSNGGAADAEPRVTGHKVFTTPDGKTGHVLVTGRALASDTDAAAAVAKNTPGGTNWWAWSSGGDQQTIVVLANESAWTDSHRQSAQQVVQSFK